jgi:hypothetical protein
MHRKLADREHAARKRARRLEKMSAEQRGAYEAWQKTHQPGSPRLRAAARERRRQQKDVAGIFDRPLQPAPVDPERQGLADLAEALRRRISDLEEPAVPSAFD